MPLYFDNFFFAAHFHSTVSCYGRRRKAISGIHRASYIFDTFHSRRVAALLARVKAARLNYQHTSAIWAYGQYALSSYLHTNVLAT